MFFDPSYISKSGKHSPGLSHFWSGQAGAVKRGQEIGAFAVGDLNHHTAFHLSASLSPSSVTLKEQGRTLMEHYVSLVKDRKADILHFGGFLAVDGYFGVSTFVKPVTALGIEVISCLKSNTALYYPAPLVTAGKKRQGRPRVKGDKIRWADLDEEQLPLICQDADKKVRTGAVWGKVSQTNCHACLGGVPPGRWFRSKPQTLFLYRHRKRLGLDFGAIRSAFPN